MSDDRVAVYILSVQVWENIHRGKQSVSNTYAEIMQGKGKKDQNKYYQLSKCMVILLSKVYMHDYKNSILLWKPIHCKN